jgi:hypothetical protein
MAVPENSAVVCPSCVWSCTTPHVSTCAFASVGRTPSSRSWNRCLRQRVVCNIIFTLSHHKFTNCTMTWRMVKGTGQSHIRETAIYSSCAPPNYRLLSHSIKKSRMTGILQKPAHLYFATVVIFVYLLTSRSGNSLPRIRLLYLSVQQYIASKML